MTQAESDLYVEALKDMVDIIPELTKLSASEDEDALDKIDAIVTRRLAQLKPLSKISDSEVDRLSEALITGNY